MGRTRRVSYEKLRDAYLAGLTTKEVGKQYGLHHSTVRYALVIMNVPRRHSGVSGPQPMKSLTSRQQTVAIKHYRAGESLRQVAKRFGVTAPTIVSALERHGVARHPVGCRLG